MIAMLKLSPSKSGGRIVKADTPHGRCHVEWDADGNLVSEWIEIREPEPPKSKGLGDTIAKATKAVGIKPCGGCDERRKKLNEKYPYGGER